MSDSDSDMQIASDDSDDESIDEALLEELREQGNEHFKNGRDEEALLSYDRALQIKPDEVKLYTNKALVLQKLERFEEALTMCSIAKHYDPKNLKAYVISMKCALSIEDVETAVSNYVEIPKEYLGQAMIIDLRDKISLAAKDKGNKFLKEGNHDMAATFYTYGVSVDPTNHILFSNRSACYQSMRKWQLAADDADSVIAISPKFVKGHLHKVRSLYQLGLMDRARVTCLDAATVLGSLPDWGDQKKVFDDELAKIDAKIAENNRRAANVSKDEKARAERFKVAGNELYSNEDYTGAISQYSQAIAACPLEGAYYGNRSAAWLMLKEYSRVVTDCNKGIELEKVPGEMNKLRRRKCDALLAVGKLDDVSAFLGPYLASPQGSVGSEVDKLRTQLSSVAEITKNLELAKQSVENREFSRSKRLLLNVQSLGLTDEPRFLLLLAKTHLGLEEFDESSRTTQTVINKLQSSSFVTFMGFNSSIVNDLTLEAYNCRASALQGQGLYEQALKHLSAAAQLDPDNSTVKTRFKAVKGFISECERIRKGYDDNYRLKKYPEAIAFATEGLNIDKSNKKMLCEMHHKRAKAHLMVGKSTKVSNPTASFTSMDKCIQDASRALYYDKSDLKSFYLKLDALEALNKLQDAIELLEEHMQNCKRNQVEDEEAPDRMKTLKALLKQANRKNLYEILGCEEGRDATDEQIKKSYKKSALKWHPDRHSSGGEEAKKIAEAKFKEIQMAHDILSDPKKRKLWDQGMEVDEIEQQAQQDSHQHSHGGNPFAQHFGGGGRHGGFGGFGGF
jgi:DnaJ family protein C protein 7